MEPKIKCVTTSSGERLYYVPSDADYNKIVVNVAQGDKLCTTETEALTEYYIRKARIKCNISKNGEKIYHLPTDKLYNVTKIDPKKGEMYCVTEEEAIVKGFARSKVR
jgi:hypothetical protein